MDSSRQSPRLWAIFLEELETHLAILEGGLLSIERDGKVDRGDERLQTLFRAAHSLKGAAQSVGAIAIETLCHHLEEIFAAVRDGRRAPDKDLFSPLLATVDAIRAAGTPSDELGASSPRPPLEALTRLQDLVPDQERTPGMSGETAVEVAERDERHHRGSPSTVVSATASTREDRTAAAASVRVTAARLDALLMESAALSVHRHATRSGIGQLAALQQQMRSWRQEWERLDRQLRKSLEGSGAGRASLKASRLLAQRLERARDQIVRLDDELLRAVDGLERETRGMSGAVDRLDRDVRQARLVPFSTACADLSRIVRDVATAGAKEVDLVIKGGTIGIDRSVVEGLRAPLMHLVRNAVDHGIESREERLARNKAPRGQVTVAARMRGAHLEVTVADDGRGLDTAALRASAERAGFSPADSGDVDRLIFLPGVSAAPTVTRISGRGVGLDAVRAAVQALRGSVSVASETGGTSFLIILPPSLATLRTLLVGSGGQRYAIDTAHIHKVLRVAPDTIRAVGTQQILSLGGASVPVASLPRLLGADEAPRGGTEKIPIVILEQGGSRVGIMVDELFFEQEVLVKTLGPCLRRVRNIAAVAALSDGFHALVLNPGDVIEGVHKDERPATAEPKPVRRVLVVDDSITTRTLIADLLTAAGYAVATASDGAEGLRRLHEEGADLVVTDVEMPRMTGLELTRHVRGDSRYRGLPIILVTALATEQDRVRGLDAGADAYLVKSSFDQGQLLATIGQLV